MRKEQRPRTAVPNLVTDFSDGRPVSLAYAGLTDHVLCFMKPTWASRNFRHLVQYVHNLAKNLLDFEYQDG